jgi:hypothetical protein
MVGSLEGRQNNLVWSVPFKSRNDLCLWLALFLRCLPLQPFRFDKDVLRIFELPFPLGANATEVRSVTLFPIAKNFDYSEVKPRPGLFDHRLAGLQGFTMKSRVE